MTDLDRLAQMAARARAAGASRDDVRAILACADNVHPLAVFAAYARAVHQLPHHPPKTTEDPVPATPERRYHRRLNAAAMFALDGAPASMVEAFLASAQDAQPHRARVDIDRDFRERIDQVTRDRREAGVPVHGGRPLPPGALDPDPVLAEQLARVERVHELTDDGVTTYEHDHIATPKDRQ